jgi:hypothetical protein
LQPRDLVVDNYDRLGIVARAEPVPDRAWLMAQEDTSVRMRTDCPWWGVIVLDGGYALVPEPHARFVREATLDDAMSAVAGGNLAAAKALVGLFPELRDLAVKLR